MEDLWKKLETKISSIDKLKDEFNAGVTEAQIIELEYLLKITLPDDFKQAYLVHNGQNSFTSIFYCFSLYSISDIIKNNLESRKNLSKEDTKVLDDTDDIKDCISNNMWIVIGDNGGSGSLIMDLDPGKQGHYGQIFAAYEDGNELLASNFRELFSNVIQDIQSGKLIWKDDEDGFGKKSTKKELDEDIALEQRVKLANKVSKLDVLLQAKSGDEILITGSLKPNYKSHKHQLFLKGGYVIISGEISRIKSPMANMPPMAKIRIKVGANRLFGLMDPIYKILSCDSLE